MIRRLRVLLIEDSCDDAELMEMALERGGFAPAMHRVETAAEMRAALAEPGWELVLSDFNLPTFSAGKALDVLHESGHDLPFIILSGAVQAEDAVELLKRGAHDFLNKDSLARLAPAIERELREAEERAKRRLAEERVRILSMAVDQSPVSVVITDCAGTIEYVNPKFQQVTGYEFAEAVGKPLHFTALQDTAPVVFAEMWVTAKHGAEWRGEFCNRRHDGSSFFEHVTVSPLTDQNGGITNFIAVKEDVTLRRSYEEKLLRQANYDNLTGLPNRVLMHDRLEQALAVANRTNGKVALLCIDLDRFKDINDSLGHAVGDQLIRSIGWRLAGCVREGDTLARLGGDDFIIVLPEIEDGRAARRMAERVIETMNVPVDVVGREHFVTASIGITLFPDDGHDAPGLLKNAEMAMYRAKEMGRNRFRFFTAEFNLRLQQRLEVEAQLRGVVQRKELELYYQPIVDLGSNRPVGAEALLRWRHPTGLRMPGDFIQVAEETGLINGLGEWVLATAFRELQPMLSSSSVLGRVAINVSPLQLREQGFGHLVHALLDEHGLTPEHLELEITESVLLDDTPETAANLQMLCDMGIRLSIDDFGTGYSSLGYLQRYPFSTLKIDRSFVSRATHSRSDGRLVETIIAMAHGLGLEVIAEGVETQEQADFLRARHCDQVQGWLYGRAEPLHVLGEMLAPSPIALQGID